jgi:hypothetical protein
MADELEGEIGALPVDQDIANLLDEEELRQAVSLEFFLQPVFGMRFGEGGEQRGGRGEGGAVALLNGGSPSATAS